MKQSPQARQQAAPWPDFKLGTDSNASTSESKILHMHGTTLLFQISLRAEPEYVTVAEGRPNY